MTVVLYGQQKVSPQAHPTAMMQAQQHTHTGERVHTNVSTPTVPPPITVVQRRVHSDVCTYSHARISFIKGETTKTLVRLLHSGP